MRIEIHHYHHDEPNRHLLEVLTSDLRRFIQWSIQKEKFTMVTLDDLQAKVAAETTVEQSIITLLAGIAAQLAAAKNDPAKIQAIADQLDANTAAMAEAVTATPIA